MSLANHPNFHAVKFTTWVVAAFYEHSDLGTVFNCIRNAYYESLRGKANRENVPVPEPIVREFVYGHEERSFERGLAVTRTEIVAFVEKVEEAVDQAVEPHFAAGEHAEASVQ